MVDEMFDRMVKGVLFAPMGFFSRQPIGEIMNRFSGDVLDLDEKLAYIRLESVFSLVGVGIMSLALMYIFPEMLLAVPVTVWLMYRNRFQLRIASQIMQLVGSSYSPCYEAIAEAIDGRHIVQAFGAHQVMRFRHEHHLHLDNFLLIEQAHYAMRSWGSLQFFKIDVLFIAAIIGAVIVRHDSRIPLFGLALHYAVTVNENVFSLYMNILDFLQTTVNARHVDEYGDIAPEQLSDPVLSTTVQVPSDWPSAGGVVFDNVSFQYDLITGPVLKNIHLSLAAGENVAVVGRTGAGKSSLTMALLRIHELTSGHILIDGVDISLIDLYKLRARIAIVPQSPLFFEGPLRSYLDPFDSYDDVVLWDASRKTGLASAVARLDGKLQAELYENAENLSLGERQLLCLSRVLLKRSRVVVLDEATAAVDAKSDESLQRVLKEEFQGQL